MNDIKEFFKSINGGCSALSWSTEDNKHLWGRNFDFNRIPLGSEVTYIPRNKEYYCCGTALENNIIEETKVKSKYAAVGTGSLFIKSTPVVYEGINEKGLMGGQLYFRGIADYPKDKVEGTMALQPPFLLTYVLTQCESVEDIVNTLKNKVTVISMPMLGNKPTIHWSFSDRTGENVIIEFTEGKMNIHRNAMGVMTNSPDYKWHCTNLLNYFNIRNLDYDYLDINGHRLEQCFSGNGSAGLPGDCSSPSRFIRLSFLRKFGVKGKDEKDGVNKSIHLLNNVAFPLGLVEVTEDGDRTEYDRNVVAFDYTIYTSIMCAESLRFYWTTYENQRVQYVDLNDLLDKDDYIQFDMDRKVDFKYINK